MYDKLIKRLRTATTLPVMNTLCQEAADAIEELAKESERWQAEARDWYLAYMDLLPTREESEGKLTDEGNPAK